MSNPKHPLKEHDLRQFTGTEFWYRHPFAKSITYTDGVKHVAEQGGAYWLVDDIVIAQKTVPAVAAEPFQFWKLKVNPDHSAILTCEDGNGNVVYRNDLNFTDFPLDEVTLYFTNNVLLLPSEY
jgi:hypothetical protein